MQPQTPDANQTPTPTPDPAPSTTPPTPGAGDQKPSGKGYGYGKRPLWQWIALYVVIGIIVYGLIYWFFFRGTGSSTSTTPLGY